MKNNNIFWISYSDLMTSLFFIMLVLFVVTIGYLQFQKQATEKQLKKIEELQTAVKRLPENYFEYQPQYKRFKLRNQIQFDRGLADIKPMYIDYLEKVGKSINDTIQKLSANENYKNFEIKYLVVIEGMASKDPYPDNFKLSYNRAFSIYKLWKNKFQNSILFNPEYCEIQISGSGIDGIREYSGVEEYKNQQILIHIVPKIGKVIEK